MTSHKPGKMRLDQLLVDRGLVSSRPKAQALILAGDVLVDDQPSTHAGKAFSLDVQIRLRNQEIPYVSRGGIKLAAAIKEFSILVTGKVALDVGASTGGFTDVLLQAGVQRVHAVDVGHNQMDWKIRNDPRVKVYEGVNARDLKPEQIGETVDLITMDVSFISVVKILPALISIAGADTDWIVLIKPQFEVGREKVGKGGIVRDEDTRQEAVRAVSQAAETLGLKRLGLIQSPIEGGKGNIEYLAYWRLHGLLSD